MYSSFNRVLEEVFEYLPLRIGNEVDQLLDAHFLVCERLVCLPRILLVSEYRLLQLSQHSRDVSLLGLCVFELGQAVCYLFQLRGAEHLLELFYQVFGALNPDIVRSAGDAETSVGFLLGDFFRWGDVIVRPLGDLRGI